MKNKLILLISGILASTSAYALDSSRFSFQLTDMLRNAMDILVKLVQTPIIRQGFSLIAFFWIMFVIYDTAIKHIIIFRDNSRKVVTPLALLSTFAVYRTVKPGVIESMMIVLVIGAILVTLFKWITGFANKMRGGFRPRRARKTQRELEGTEKREVKLDRDIDDSLADLEQEVDEEIGAEKTEEKRLKKSLKKADDAIDSLKGIIKAVNNKSEWKYKHNRKKFRKNLEKLGKNLTRSEKCEIEESEKLHEEEESIKRESQGLFEQQDLVSSANMLANETQNFDPAEIGLTKKEVQRLDEIERDIKKMHELSVGIVNNIVEEKRLLSQSRVHSQRIREFFKEIPQLWNSIPDPNAFNGLNRKILEIKNEVIHKSNLLKKLKELDNGKLSKINEMENLQREKEHDSEIVEKLAKRGKHKAKVDQNRQKNELESLPPMD